MLRISDSIQAIIEQNPSLMSAIKEGLINLSALATRLCPLIEARTKKRVTRNAVHMALSRYQRQLSKKSKIGQEKFEIQSITIHSDLCVLNYFRSPEGNAGLSNLYNKIHSIHGYMTITQGTSETTIIIEKKFIALARKLLTGRPRRKQIDVAAISIRFDARYLEVPGYLYSLLQLLVLQGINIIELASTATEIVFYLNESDIRLAFDTFSQQGKRLAY